MKRFPTTALLALMMFVVPAAGAPHEELLQDTLKSMLVVFFALITSFIFFWQLRKQPRSLSWHGLMFLPLLLFVYALGSMVWSHPYLGGVEAIRWLIFSLLFFLAVNTLSLRRVTHLAWGIHLGAVIASLWTAFQFWFDFKFFAQGPSPASTFVNRNFFGEYLVCTLPFSILLLSRLKDKASVFLLTFSLSFNLVALMMTGTRSALMGLLVLVVLLPVILARFGSQFTSTGWHTNHVAGIVALLIASVACVGSIDSANPAIVKESGRVDALHRAFQRATSMTQKKEYTQGSFSVRTLMWQTTGRMILANPTTGVGAGAWEVQSPLYQESGSQIETDYYAHNEILQLLAEYGLIGWLFIVTLLIYLATATYKTCSDKRPKAHPEALLRSLTLCSLWVLLLVSNAGFPWRMATTGALFALSLAVLANSDLRHASKGLLATHNFYWEPHYATLALCLTAVLTGIALYISQQAIACESKFVRAIQIAMTISRSSAPNDPAWDKAKIEMIKLVEEGIVINRHYRKLTPIVADSLASWGDWKNATWIWEKMLESRPNVVVMLANVALGHIQLGNFEKSQVYLNRAIKIAPTAPVVESVQVVLLSRTGKIKDAAIRAKALLASGVNEPSLIVMAYELGKKIDDPELSILALQSRIRIDPKHAVDALLQIGAIYSVEPNRDDSKAVQAYRAALAATPVLYKNTVLSKIPMQYRIKIEP